MATQISTTPNNNIQSYDIKIFEPEPPKFIQSSQKKKKLALTQKLPPENDLSRSKSHRINSYNEIFNKIKKFIQYLDIY